MPLPLPSLVPILRFLRQEIATLQPGSATDQQALQQVVAYVVQVLDQLPGNQLLSFHEADARSPFHQLEALHLQLTRQYVTLSTLATWERTLWLLDVVLREAIGDAT